MSVLTAAPKMTPLQSYQNPVVSHFVTGEPQTEQQNSYVSLVMNTVKKCDSGINVSNLSAAAVQLSILKDQQSKYPDWFFDLELVDIDTADRYELISLFTSAPSAFLQGFIYSKILARIELGQMTSRSPWTEALDDETEHAHNTMLFKIHQKLNDLQVSSKEWFQVFDSTDLNYCHLDEIRDLMQTSPTELAQGILFGTLTFRMHMEWVTKAGAN